MTRSALLIGGTGFLGQGIVAALRQDAWQVTTLSRRATLANGGEIAHLQADRTVAGALAAAIGERTFDLVVDCAAYQRPDAEGAIATLAGRIGQYVFISTDFVYSPAIAGPFPIGEDAPKETERPYGTGKLACEAALHQAWQERAFPSTVLRPPHILGRGKPLGTGSVQGRDPHLLDHLRAGTDLTLIGEGLLLIQPVWHREVGACIAHLAGNVRTFGGVYNCTGPDCVTSLRYYELVAQQLGVELRYASVPHLTYLAEAPQQAPFARHRIYDLRRLEDACGYHPHYPLEEAIAETIEGLAGAPTAP